MELVRGSGRPRPVVLIVDDDEGVRDALHLILGDEYVVLDAAHGRLALGVLHEQHVDIVLLDVLMPDVDGIEILQEIRALEPQLPVIMMTAVKTVRTAVAAMKLGAADYITKPFVDDELLDTIRRVLDDRERWPTVSVGRGWSEHASRLTRPLCMLVVGGDPGWRASIAVALERAGATETAPSLADGLGRLLRFRPSCVVLNIGRPSVDAVRFVATSQAELPACQVIVVSDDIYVDATPSWAALNIRHIVRTPVQAGELIGRIGAVLAPCHVPTGTWPRLGVAVSRTIDHVASHLSEDLTVDRLADAAGVSGSHLAHLFQAETGMTVHSYLTKVRIEVAKDLLQRTDEKLAGIATYTGFFDASHLARVFRRSTGTSPKEFRGDRGLVGRVIRPEPVDGSSPSVGPDQS